MLRHSLADGLREILAGPRGEAPLVPPDFRSTFSLSQLTSQESIHINLDECQFVDSKLTIRVRALIPTPRKIDGVYANYAIVSFSMWRFGSAGMMPNCNCQEPLAQALKVVRHRRFTRQSRVKLG